MTAAPERACPGCGLRMPADPQATYDGYYNTTPECWSVYGEVLGAEFGNAVVFGQVHSLTVDTYAVQHTGGSHPDKSVAVHLVGLHLALEHRIPPPLVPRHLQKLASSVATWPHFAAPRSTGPITVFDIALASSPVEHVESVRRWAATVWAAWAAHHAGIAAFATARLDLRARR